ncbi:MAG: glycerol-3-phosphate acyltransferase [Anaerolineaceae bacterium]|nr:glycerol-3-phosphate acyltransferase [Anaerolineaceae bacterium]
MIPAFLSLPIAYLIGSIPSGLLVVRVATGQDVRFIESGRTGGTNVMRAAGFLAGLATGILDILKGAAAVWVCKSITAETEWMSAVSGLLAIIGHNYSAFLIEKGEDGKIRFKGGAGGATTLGAAIGLWAQSWMFILPFALLFYVIVGYASLTTISIATATMGVFLVRAIEGNDPWGYVAFGAAAVVTVVIALRPNLQRLKEGTERRVNLISRVFKTGQYKKE